MLLSVIQRFQDWQSCFIPFKYFYLWYVILFKIPQFKSMWGTSGFQLRVIDRFVSKQHATSATRCVWKCLIPVSHDFLCQWFVYSGQPVLISVCQLKKKFWYLAYCKSTFFLTKTAFPWTHFLWTVNYNQNSKRITINFECTRKLKVRKTKYIQLLPVTICFWYTQTFSLRHVSVES